MAWCSAVQRSKPQRLADAHLVPVATQTCPLNTQHGGLVLGRGVGVGGALPLFVLLYIQMYDGRMKITGFDWDSGNWPKCAKHGLTKAEVEQVLMGNPAVMSDPNPSEPRMRAIGKTNQGRYVFLVFVPRVIHDQTLLRPISARFMHQKEIEHYENQNKI